MTPEFEPIATIFTLLTTTPSRWNELTSTLPETLLRLSPAAGEWSALECLQHIIDVERVFQSRLRAFLDGMESFPAFNPDAEGGLDAAQRAPCEIAAEFAELRITSLEAIGKLLPGDLKRTSRHPELGMVTLEEMLNEWPAHDLNHTVQAERALMQPYIQNCGPWQVFFKDHAIEII